MDYPVVHTNIHQSHCSTCLTVQEMAKNCHTDNFTHNLWHHKWQKVKGDGQTTLKDFSENSSKTSAYKCEINVPGIFC